MISGDGSHLVALLSALLAGFDTLLAVLHLMVGAFVTAGLADVCAQGANGCGMLAAAGHGCCGQRADLGTIYIQGDALCHHLHVLLLQA